MIGKIVDRLDNLMRKGADPVSKFLDDHPKVYKIYIFSMHFFRSTLMFALMTVSPLPVIVTVGLMGGASFLYFAGVEKKFCNFKFTIPSTFGGIALWMAKAAIIKIVAGTAFINLGAFLIVSAGLTSLVLYTTWVCYISHRDIRNYFEKKHLASTNQNPCCAGI
jgi:hypothetical protein